jgi:haloalkane dehalogenase
VVRPLSTEEKRRYAEPYPTVGSRKPLWRWPNEIPIDGSPPDVHTIVSEYSRKLQPSEIPKLLFCAHPGGIIGAKELDWCRSTLKNLETVDIRSGIHYLQEDNPHQIGSELAHWYRALD